MHRNQPLDGIDSMPVVPPVVVQTTLRFTAGNESASEAPMSEAKANDFITRLSSMWNDTLQDAPSRDTITGVTVTVR